MKRRRFATRDELFELLAGREPDINWPRVIEVLTAVGVEVDTLVQVVVDEEV